MDSFPRLWPFLRPHRYKLVVSAILGVFIAVLWGANLTVALPVIKILLENTEPAMQAEAAPPADGVQDAAPPAAIVKRSGLHHHVHTEVATSTEQIRTLEQQLEALGAEIAARKAGGHPAGEEVLRLIQRQTRLQNELAAAGSRLWQFTLLQTYVMPYVPRNEFQILCWLLLGVLAATALKGALIFCQDMLVGRIAESTVRDLRQELLRKSLELDYQTLSLEGKSGLLSRFTYDSEQLSFGISMLGGKMIREPLKCLACMLLALWWNWRLTLLSLVFIPLMALFLGKFGKMMKRASRRMMDSMSQIYKVLEETFDGLKIVIGYNTAPQHQQAFAKQYDAYFKKALGVVKVDSAARPLMELLGMGAMFAALIPGAYLVLRARTDVFGMQLADRVMDGSQLALLYVLLAGMLDPSRKMSGGFARLKRCTAAIDRIFQLMDMQSLLSEARDPAPFEPHTQSIELKDVSFRYATRDVKHARGLALEHVDLEIAFGEVVAVVGQNGCGKSTLVNLLPRYYDPDAGEVLIDGRPLKEISLTQLRQQVGVVTQETILFDGTILDNLRYGSPQATLQQVEEACRQAHVLPIIQSLPQGYQTTIGDSGKQLSGGQRQRIALARVMLRNPSILILDEATSAADAESESLIHLALKDFVKGRTTLLISHTMSHSLLNFVTRIVVMESGKIVASGTHEELLKVCPLYHRLYHAPSRQVTAVPAAKAA